MAYRKNHYQKSSKFHKNGQYDFLEVQKSWKALLDINDDADDETVFDKLMLLKPEKPIRIALLDSGIWIDHCAFSHCCTDKNFCCKTKSEPECVHQNSKTNNSSCCKDQITNVKLPEDEDEEEEDEEEEDEEEEDEEEEDEEEEDEEEEDEVIIVDGPGDGHGTSIASLIIGGHYKPIELTGETSDTFTCVHHKEEFYNGIAPFSKLISYEVLHGNKPNQVDEERRLIKAIKHCLLSDEKPDIMSISIGFDDDARFNLELYKAINEVVSAGIIVVCCASNEGNQNSRSIKYPAKFGNVICVGSHDTNGQPSLFSSHGREIDFLGIGESILLAAIPSNYAKIMDFQKMVVSKEEGTSFSAPFVAGICGLLLMYAEVKGSKELRKDMTNTLVMKTILQKMSTRSGSHDQVHGYGHVIISDLLDMGPGHLKKLVEGVVEKNAKVPYVSELTEFHLLDVISLKKFFKAAACTKLSDADSSLYLYCGIDMYLNKTKNDFKFLPYKPTKLEKVYVDMVSLSETDSIEMLHKVFKNTLYTPIDHVIVIAENVDQVCGKRYLSYPFVDCKKCDVFIGNITRNFLIKESSCNLSLHIDKETILPEKGLSYIAEWAKKQRIQVLVSKELELQVPNFYELQKDNDFFNVDPKTCTRNDFPRQHTYFKGKDQLLDCIHAWQGDTKVDPFEIVAVSCSEIYINDYIQQLQSTMADLFLLLEDMTGKEAWLESYPLQKVVRESISKMEVMNFGNTISELHITFPRLKSKSSPKCLNLLDILCEMQKMQPALSVTSTCRISLPFHSCVFTHIGESLKHPILRKAKCVSFYGDRCVPRHGEMCSIMKWTEGSEVLKINPYVMVKMKLDICSCSGKALNTYIKKTPPKTPFFFTYDLYVDQKPLFFICEPDVNQDVPHFFRQIECPLNLDVKGVWSQIWSLHRPENSTSSQFTYVKDKITDVSADVYKPNEIQSSKESFMYDKFLDITRTENKHLVIAMLAYDGINLANLDDAAFLLDFFCSSKSKVVNRAMYTDNENLLLTLLDILMHGRMKVIFMNVREDISEEPEQNYEHTASALCWLSQKYYKPEPADNKPDILLIPFGLQKFNKHIYEKINEMSRSGTIVVTAAAERESTYLRYPGCYGDVLCVGTKTGPKGRELDFVACDSFRGLSGTDVAATYVAGIVANLLTYAEVTGGPELKKRICFNGAMRALLQSACTTPGQHSEATGHGMLDPLKLVKYGPEFKTIINKYVK